MRRRRLNWIGLGLRTGIVKDCCMALDWTSGERGKLHRPKTAVMAEDGRDSTRRTAWETERSAGLMFKTCAPHGTDRIKLKAQVIADENEIHNNYFKSKSDNHADRTFSISEGDAFSSNHNFWCSRWKLTSRVSFFDVLNLNWVVLQGIKMKQLGVYFSFSIQEWRQWRYTFNGQAFVLHYRVLNESKVCHLS